MNEKQKIHTARCMCGDVVLEARGEPKVVEYCHCKWCQQSAGSAYVIWIIFDKENAGVTSGELSYYRKSDVLERGFCARCGCTMAIRSHRHFDITLGVMDHPEDFPIDRHIWTSSAMPQINLDDDLLKYEESEPD